MRQFLLTWAGVALGMSLVASGLRLIDAATEPPREREAPAATVPAPAVAVLVPPLSLCLCPRCQDTRRRSA